MFKSLAVESPQEKGKLRNIVARFMGYVKDVAMLSDVLIEDIDPPPPEEVGSSDAALKALKSWLANVLLVDNFCSYLRDDRKAACRAVAVYLGSLKSIIAYISSRHSPDRRYERTMRVIDIARKVNIKRNHKQLREEHDELCATGQLMELHELHSVLRALRSPYQAVLDGQLELDKVAGSRGIAWMPPTQVTFCLKWVALAQYLCIMTPREQVYNELMLADWLRYSERFKLTAEFKSDTDNRERQVGQLVTHKFKTRNAAQFQSGHRMAITVEAMGIYDEWANVLRPARVAASKFCSASRASAS